MAKGEIIGVAKGVAEGEIIGMEKRNRQTARNMIRMGMALEQIGEALGLDVEQVKKLLA